MKAVVDKYLGIFLAFLMALMVVDVVWQVTSRYIFQAPSSITDELARYLLIWIGVLGAAYVSGQGKHLAIDLLPQKLKGDRRKRLMFGIHLLIFLFSFTVLVLGGLRLVYITLKLGQLSSALQIPLGLIYCVIPLSGLLVCYYKFHAMITPEVREEND